MKTRHDNVTLYYDRHRKLRARFRKTGLPVYNFKNLPDTPGFDEELKLAKAGKIEVEPPRTVIPRSVSDGLRMYYPSGNFLRGSLADQGRRRGILERFRKEYGDDLVADFEFQHIEAILLARKVKTVDERGRPVGGPVAATNLKKQLNRFFRYMKKIKWIAHNPLEEVEHPSSAKVAGFHTWTEAEIAQYKKRHPLGTKARLAIEIILWTWQRRGDARLFGPKHIIRGKINFTASKNQANLWLPIPPDLDRAIKAMPSVGIQTYLVTEYGKPFSAEGFGNKMRQWCDEADLPHCSAHGLRKAAATRAAQSEATQQGLKAVGGWRGDEEVTTYTAAVEQEALAESTMKRVVERYGDDA